MTYKALIIKKPSKCPFWHFQRKRPDNMGSYCSYYNKPMSCEDKNEFPLNCPLEEAHYYD